MDAQADAAFKEYDELRAKVTRHETAERIEREMAERNARPDTSRRPDGGNSEASGTDDGNPISYRQAFAEYLMTRGNVGAMSLEARSALQSGYSTVQVPEEQRAQTTAAAAGGYTIPEEMLPVLVETMIASGPMYDPGVTFEIVTGGGNAIPIPTVDDTTSTAAASAGEGVTLTDDGGKDVAFGEKQLDAYSFDTEWIRVSLELDQDSAFAMESVIGRLLGKRLGRLANSQLTVGTGSSAPNGIATAATSGVTAASATAIAWDELISLEHAVDPAYRGNPKVRYMFHDDTLELLRKLKDGDGNYLWNMGDQTKGVEPSLMGKAYSINQAMPQPTTGNKAILFGDFDAYFVRKVGAPLIGAIQDKDFWPGFGVAGWIRFDGELSDAAAIRALTMA